MKYIIEIDSKILEDAKTGYVRLREIADAVKATATPYTPTEDSAFKEEVIRMVNMGVYPEAIVEWVRENGGE